MPQCEAICRSGRRCSITTACSLRDAISGKLAALPLQAGGRHCLFHTILFVTEPSTVDNALFVFVDLETTGLSIADDSIVEIGCTDLQGASFGVVVRPPDLSRASAASSVHGIDLKEIERGAPFPEAFSNLVDFLDNLSRTIPEEDDSSDDECASQTRFRETATIVLVGHNLLKFDCPMLCSECIRQSVSWTSLMYWRYVDTLEVLRAVDSGVVGGCVKLQCLVQRCAPHSDLRSHRALDDSIALRDVVLHVSGALGVSPSALLRPFIVSMEAACTRASMHMLLGAT